MIGVFGHAAPYCARLNKPTKLVYPKPCLKSIQTGGFSLQTTGGMRHLRAERVRNAGICNNFEGPAPLLQNVPGMGENVEFSTQIHIRQLILEKIAKGVWFRIKKLSYFRLENYKLYAPCGGMSNQIVENSVENVKFHRENRLCSRTFELSPPGFQHVEKIGSFYGMYSPLLWKTFRTGKTAGPGRGRRRSSKGQFCKTGPGRRQAAKKSGRADKKAAICWQTRSAYAILYLGLSSDKIVGLAACASGAARPGEHALHRSDRNGRRT